MTYSIPQSPAIQLTTLDIAKLSYPFPKTDHDFLEGFVYISEEAITDRIERIDPTWSFRIDQIIALGDSVVCIATLTIKGVSRSNGGGNPIQRDKQDKDAKGNKLGSYTPLPLYTVADNGVNAHKSAITDALKRCARLFGVGRYLLSAPKENSGFDRWLEQQTADAKAALLKLQQTDTETGEITPTAAAPKASATTPSTLPIDPAAAASDPTFYADVWGITWCDRKDGKGTFYRLTGLDAHDSEIQIIAFDTTALDLMGFDLAAITAKEKTIKGYAVKLPYIVSEKDGKRFNNLDAARIKADKEFESIGEPEAVR